jgi:hypothetical protein
MISRVPKIPILRTSEVADMPAKPVSARTVEREIRRGNLEATKIGGRFFVDPHEARRWAATYLPYREQHERHQPEA